MEFNVTLSAPVARTVSVDYTTADGSGLAGEDYTPLSGTLVFEPGLDAIRYAPEFRAVWNALPKLTLEAPYPGGPALRRR